MSHLEWKPRDCAALYEPGRIFCLGGNYPDHRREMNYKVDKPSIFAKISGSLQAGEEPIVHPGGGHELHYEGEFVLVLGDFNGLESPTWDDVLGITVGLDLTLRDIQRVCRRDGTPWEMAKSFPGAARLAPIVLAERVKTPSELEMTLRVNGELRQRALLSDMERNVNEILAMLHDWMPLTEGDVIFTGTPQGVGPLVPGDTVELALTGWTSRRWAVVDD